MKILLSEAKPFYKAALHCHSQNSDGALSVEELKEAFKKQGYSVVAFTDHEHLIDNSYLDDEDFLTITSCEIAIKQYPAESTLKNYCMKVTHLNFYALDKHNVVTPCYNSVYDHFKNPRIEPLVKHRGEYERVYSHEGVSAIIKEASQQGFLVSYNHPYWSLENATDYLGYEGLFAVEIYNHGVDVAGGNSYCPSVFDDLLRSGKKVFCTMCDDNHNRHPLDSCNSDIFGGFVMINAEKLDYETIMTALQKGDFYASQGPEIKSLVLDGDTVTVKTSPAERISLSTCGRRTDAVNAEKGEGVTEAVFKVRECDKYFRITVTDEKGRHAHSQSYEV